MSLRKSIYLILICILMLFLIITCSSGETQVVEEDPVDEVEEEEVEDVHLEPNEAPIFYYEPKVGEKSFGKDNLLREMYHDNEVIKDPILLGYDDNNNFLLYDYRKKQVIKYSNDATLGAIILDDEMLFSSNGEYLNGFVKDKALVLLQKLNNEMNAFKIKFFDTSGNIDTTRNEIHLANISSIILEQGIEVDSKFIFHAENVHLDNDGNVIITINETSTDNDHIDNNRPIFLIYDNNGDFQKVITIHPPEDTSFGISYWKESGIEKFKLSTIIYNNYAFILWGSGYSGSSSIGYMYQKISLKSGGAGLNFTRNLKPEYNEGTVVFDTLPDTDSFVSRGIWVDNDNVYIRLNVDGVDVIDIFNSRNDYNERYVISDDIEGIGETTLSGPNNIIVKDNIAILASDKGLNVINFSN